MRTIFLFILLSAIHVNISAQRLQELEGRAQGTYYIIKYISADTTSLQHDIDLLFSRVDASLSLYKPGSLINRFNQEGRVKMDNYMQEVVRKSLYISKITGGAFDITVKPLVDAWGFGVKVPASRKIPDNDTLQQLLTRVGYQYLKISGEELLRTKQGVEIDCNGIAQGYTTDVIARFLTSKGIKDYLIDVGGELCSRGTNQYHQTWTVGIECPDSADYPMQALVKLDNKAITTSGNYRRFFDEGGTRFAHTIDPHTGQALHNDIISVTVMAPDAMTADGFDNALILMGVDNALAFIRQHPSLELEVYFIYKDANGQIQERYSPGFKQYLLPF